MGWMRSGGFAVALFAGSYVDLAVALDAYGRGRSADGCWDAIVVAGCRVDADGRPSLALQRRTRKAVELWEAGLAQRVLFTGGVGAFPPSEASAAGAYAESLGLPASAVVLEEESTSTEENARFGAEQLGPDARVLVVTDAYHVFRAERVFDRHFAEVVGVGSMPSWDVRLKGSLREVAAVTVYAFRGRL